MFKKIMNLITGKGISVKKKNDTANSGLPGKNFLSCCPELFLSGMDDADKTKSTGWVYTWVHHL